MLLKADITFLTEKKKKYLSSRKKKLIRNKKHKCLEKIYRIKLKRSDLMSDEFSILAMKKNKIIIRRKIVGVKIKRPNFLLEKKEKFKLFFLNF